MKNLTLNNLQEFALIDEIHSGFIELKNSAKLKTKLQQQGGEMKLQPIATLNQKPKDSTLVKCQRTGSFFITTL